MTVELLNSQNERIEIKDFFPNEVLITKLKKFQKIGFECELVSGTGLLNARHTPTCTTSFIYLPKNPDYNNLSWKDELDYEKDKNGDPVGYLFDVQSLGYWTPKQLILQGISAFERRIKNAYKKYAENTKKEISVINGLKSELFLLDDEDTTIGSLLQEYVMRYFDSEYEYAGYVIEHPKKRILKFRITSDKNEIVSRAFRDQLDDITRFRNLVETNFNE